MRASRKSSHSSPKLQVISRKVGDLLRRSSTVAGSGVVSRPGACCFLSKWLASHSFPTARCHHRPMAGACKHTNKDRSLWGARSRFLTAPSLCWISHPRQGNRHQLRLLPRTVHNKWLNGIPRAWIVSFGDLVHRPMAGIRSHLRHIVLIIQTHGRVFPRLRELHRQRPMARRPPCQYTTRRVVRHAEAQPPRRRFRPSEDETLDRPDRTCGAI